MATLPDKADLISGAVSEGDYQLALGELYDVVSQGGGGPIEEIEIVSGTITPTSGYIIVDTENSSSTDNLDHIIPTNYSDGSIIFIQSKTSARDVVFRHNQAGSGKIKTLVGINTTLYTENILSCLRYDDDNDQWIEIYNNSYMALGDTASKTLMRSLLGLSEAATKAVGTNSGQIPTADLLGALAFKSTVSSSDLASNSVTASKIPDDTITLGKMAHGTPNTYIGYNSSGQPEGVSLSTDSFIERQVFSTVGTSTWTKPAGCKYVKVYITGGGGGGGGLAAGSQNGGFRAATGGTSSFGSHVSATGGQGGLTNYAQGSTGGTFYGDADYGDAGIGVDGDINQSGFYSIGISQGLGSGSNTLDNSPNSGNASRPGGGGGGRSTAATGGVNGGGSGGWAYKLIYNPSASESVVVGAGGQGSNSNNLDGYSGFRGEVIVEAYA